MKLKNKFIIIIPLYNAKDLIERCLMSIFSQRFDDLGVIIRDDISNDGTETVVKEILMGEGDEIMTSFMGKDVIYIRNKSKLYPLGNTYESVINYVDNDDAIIGVVDGDDALTSALSVQKIYDVYVNDPSKWLVWSQHKCSNGQPGQSRPLPPDNVIYSNRNYWSVTHFRTSRAKLFHNLDTEDLKDPFVPNTYYTFSGDAAFLFPFIEMCGNEHSHFINEPLYLYNNDLPTNEHNKNRNNAIKYGMHIKTTSRRYKKLDKL